MYPRDIESYSLVEFLGEGTYGEAFSATVNKTGEVVAIKRTKNNEKGAIMNYQTELFAYKTFAHPNILTLYAAFCQFDICYLVFELMDSDANDTMFDEFDIRDFTKSIFSAINYIHSLGFVHLDIKPANILIKDLGNKRHKWVLADMGFVCNPEIGECRFGSPYFMPPESYLPAPLQGRSLEDYKKVDLWSIGVTIGYLFSETDGNVVQWAIAIYKYIQKTGGLEKVLNDPEELNLIYNGNDSIQYDYEHMNLDDFEAYCPLLTQDYIDLAWIFTYRNNDNFASKISRYLINVDLNMRYIPFGDPPEENIPAIGFE